MKQIVAIVRPHLSEKIIEALRRSPVESVTVREVKGYGRQKDNLAAYEETDFSLAFLPKVEIAIWVDDARVEEVVQRVESLASTGRMGDGKVFIVPCQKFVQVVEIAAPPKEPRGKA